MARQGYTLGSSDNSEVEDFVAVVREISGGEPGRVGGQDRFQKRRRAFSAQRPLLESRPHLRKGALRLKLAPRMQAIVGLLIAVILFFALKTPLQWLVEHQRHNLRRAQGLQSLPLYAIPYFVIQLVSGLDFESLHQRWNGFHPLVKAASVIVSSGVAVVVVYAGHHIGLNALWVGGRG